MTINWFVSEIKKMMEEEVRRVHDISNPHLICMRLASMLQGALGVTGTGMPCFYNWTEKKKTGVLYHILFACKLPSAES